MANAEHFRQLFFPFNLGRSAPQGKYRSLSKMLFLLNMDKLLLLRMVKKAFSRLSG